MLPRFIILLLGLFFQSGWAQLPLNQLKLRSPLPTSADFAHAVFGNGRYVVLGGPRTLFSSADADNWEPHFPDDGFQLVRVAFGNGKFLFEVGTGSTVYLTEDLTNWTRIRPENYPSRVNHLTYLDGRFLALARNQDLAFSSDGETWEEVAILPADDNRVLEEIAFGNGRWVVVGDDGLVLTSPDLETWTERDSGLTPGELSSDLLSVAYLNDRFVAGGKDGTLLSSTDGITWQSHVSGSDAFISVLGYYGGQFTFAGRRGEVFQSTDLTNWDTSSTWTGEGLVRDVQDLVSDGNGQVLAVGRTGLLSTTTDFMTWTDRQEVSIPFLQQVTHDGDRFLALGGDGEQILASNDGLSWEIFYEIPQPVSYFAYEDEKYVVATFRGEISQSLDGTLWSSFTPAIDGILGNSGIHFVNGRWLFLGAGQIWMSTNLTNWTQATITGLPTDGSSTSFLNVTFGNGVYVATGRSGLVVSSTNGSDWMVRDSGATQDLFTLAFFNNRFLTGATFNNPIVSLDGETWTTQDLTGLGRIGTFAVVDGFFVNATRGEFTVSADLESWNTVNLGTSGTFFELVKGGNRFLARASSNAIYVSDLIPQRRLTVQGIGGGTVTVTPQLERYFEGTTVILEAVPGQGTGFASWSGDASGAQNPLSFTIEGDTNIIANFQATLSGYDLWRASEFPAGDRDDDAISGPLADPDGDGRSNTVEYYFASSPLVSDSDPLVSLSFVTLGVEKYGLLTWKRRIGVNDLTTVVEVGADLAAWQSNATAPSPVTEEWTVNDNGDGSETISHRALAPVSSQAAYYFRVRAE